MKLKNNFLPLKLLIEKKEHDMITSYAAMAYTRIMRTSDNDVSAVFDLFKSGGFSVINCALRSISAYRLMPPEGEIKRLISLTENFPQKK